MTVKGGVAKSFISALIAQAARKNGKTTPVLCADPGTSNPTFSSYKGLGATHIDAMTSSMNIDKRKFDSLVVMLINYSEWLADFLVAADVERMVPPDFCRRAA